MRTIRVGVRRGEGPATTIQFPPAAANAMTIHKAQGRSIDGAIIDLGPAEVSAGPTYMALRQGRAL